MKALLTSILCLTVSVNVFSQELLAQAKPVDSDEWGYINPKGDFIIPAQYRNCNAFSSDGLAAIYDKKSKQFYFIDTKNNRLETDVKDFKLKNIFGFGTVGFVDNMAMVEIDRKWGYLDKKGHLSVAAKYDDATVFDNGYALVKSKDKWLIIDKVGTEQPIQENVEDAKHFQEGLAPVKVGDNYGFVNTTGKLVVEAKFKSVGYFVHGKAWAKTESGKIGFIDPSGNWVIEPIYDAAKDGSYSTACTRVKENDQWKFIDKKGTVVDAASADSYGNFEDGLAYAKVGGLVGFISATGAWAIEPQFEAVRDFKNGYAAAKQGDKWGFIDKTGNWVIKPQFDSVKDFEKAGK
ncbi:MAG: hypothetical protein GC178_14720 [Flavobacteriales bacterium]|nr:hypothetical protein [Flavobacteriales bacterium]